MELLLKEVAGFIKSERRKQKIKAEDIAEATGYSEGHIRNLECGEGNINAANIGPILKCLGYDWSIVVNEKL